VSEVVSFGGTNRFVLIGISPHFLRNLYVLVKDTVPLVYPEGMIPSSLLRHGFASVTDHLRSRLNNLSLRTSTDPRYIFHAFDCFANVSLHGEESCVVLSCGFVESQGGGGVWPNRSKYFNTDSINSHLVINQLSAAIAEGSSNTLHSKLQPKTVLQGLQTEELDQHS
jgi:hypothetical protein